MGRTKLNPLKKTGIKTNEKFSRELSFNCHGSPKRNRYRPGKAALREIRKYQKPSGSYIRKATFDLLLRDIAREIKSDIKFQSTAVLALHEAAEAYLIAWLG